MREELLIALCDSIISKKIDNISVVRGPRGLRGKSGEDFIFSDHEQKIVDLIAHSVNEINVEEIDYTKLVLNFDCLSEEQKLELKGSRGQRGKPGTDFNFENELDSISEIITSHINSLKIKGDSGEAGVDGEKGERGPRGQKGSRGKDFSFSESKEDIHKDIVDYFLEIKDDLKLSYSDLSSDELENLKGRDGDVGEKGDRGARGQKGSRGSDGMSSLEIWQEVNDGSEEDFLSSLRGSKGIDGLHGINGKAGRDGVRGRNGLNGFNGLDAPVIIDIEIELTSENHFRFIFYYSDNLVFKTNDIKLPKSDNIQQFIMGGGSSSGGGTTLNISQDGVELGPAETMDFSTGFDLIYDEETKKVTVDYQSKIEVLDEGIFVSDQVQTINFVGKNVTVAATDSISNWENLEDVGSLDEVDLNPTVVNVIIDGGGADDATRIEITRVATGNIAKFDPVSLITATNVSTSDVTGNDIATVTGIALNSAVNGEDVVIVTFGNISDPFFNFALNAPLWNSALGPVSDQSTTLVGEFFCRVGKSNGPGSILVKPEYPTEVF